VTKYMREREAATVKNKYLKGQIKIRLTHSLDKSMYNIPLTLKTYVPSKWSQASIWKGKKGHQLAILNDVEGNYIIYQAQPNDGEVTISGI